MRFSPALCAVLRLLILGCAMVLMGTAKGDDLMRVTGVTRSGNTVQIDFTSRPGATGLVVKGWGDLASWPDNLTGVSTITERSPGV